MRGKTNGHGSAPAANGDRRRRPGPDGPEDARGAPARPGWSRSRAQQAARLRRPGPAGAQDPPDRRPERPRRRRPQRGRPRGERRPGDRSADPKADPGKVTVPPPATPDQRLPIFDSLESDWFRRSGKTVGSARPSPGAQGVQGAQGAQGAQGVQAGQPAAHSSWTSPADEGWRAAQALAAPAAGDTTQAGLPRRVPRANLVPGSVGGGGGDAEADAPTRSPDAARTRMASFQRGVREGRAAAPQTEEP